jgi:RNA polymerase sigma factor (sigma-70 family)
METNERDSIILQHLDLANKLAYAKIKSTSKRISLDELKSSAYFGLVSAAEKYKENGSSFAIYATMKIKGSMKDYLRELKWGTRKNRVESVPLLDVFVKKENNISSIISDLKLIEKKIILMYYEGGYTLKEIGKELGVKESWISQLLSKARKTIKDQYAA